MGVRIGLAVAAAAAMACGGAGAVRRGEPSGPPVLAVDIVGNATVSDGELIRGLATRPPGLLGFSRTRYDPLALELDRERIETYYRARGLFDARVRVEVRERRAGVAVRIEVDEGARTQVAAVEVTGAPAGEAVDAAALRALVPLAAGDPFDHAAYLRGRARVERRLVRRGHPFAKVDGTVAVDRDRRVATIRLAVDPGPLVRYGRTVVRGLDRLPESAVHARTAWDPGEVYDPEDLRLTEGRLYQLGYLSSVRFELADEGRPAVADVIVEVREARRHELRLGGGVGFDDSRFEVRARAGYVERGFADPLTTLRLDLRPGYTVLRAGQSAPTGFGGEALAELVRHDLAWPRLRGAAQVAYTVVEEEAYSLQGPRVRLAVDRPFARDRILVGLGWQLRYQDFFTIHPAIGGDAGDLGIVDPYRLGAFDQSVSYDLRDDPLDARRGLYLDLRLEEGGPFAGGRFSYVKVSPEIRAFAALDRRLVAAARVRAGTVLGDPDPLPITQRYFAGGASSQRGFAHRRLAPSLSDGDDRVPVGGEALVETSVELRADLFRMWDEWFGVVAFLDGADVAAEPGQLDLVDLHWAAGAGLRYDTIVGPLRFDVGYRLNRHGAGEPDPGDRWAFHLSLGEAF